MVLASELLVIRQLVPFVGSGTEIIAIIISAVLLPLAVGYHQGGRLRSGMRRRLIRNVLAALAVLTLGLSYPMLELFFAALNALGIQQPALQASLYCLLFLVYPIYLLAQTVPLVSNFFSKTNISTLTGRMLFFSTLGSFLGSVFSTLVLMNTLGVHSTAMVTLLLLALLVPLLVRRFWSYPMLLALMLGGMAIALNSPATMRHFKVVSNNAYNLIMVHESPTDGRRTLMVNRGNSSQLTKDGSSPHAHVRAIETRFIAPIAKEGAPPREILVLGAGGFTIGLDDAVNRYTYVDIDPAMLQVAEQHFLKRTLGANKRFVAQSARAFVTRTTDRYDLLIIDTYTNLLSPPMETTTAEFLEACKALLKPGGILIVNQILQPDISDRFSVRYDRTFARVFGQYNREVLQPYNPWEPHSRETLRNVLYTYFDRSEQQDSEIYTDDRNPYSIDRYRF